MPAAAADKYSSVHLAQIIGPINPIDELTISNITLTMSTASGMIATASAVLADIPVSVTVGINSKTAQLAGSPKLFFNATTTSAANLAKVAKSLWPGMPSTAADLLKQASFSKLQAAYDSSSKRLSISAASVASAGGSSNLAALSGLSDFSYAVSYSSPQVVFLSNPAYLRVGVKADLPSINARNVAATLEVSAGSADLLLMVIC